MAIKKPELYNSIWKIFNTLRGGMDASQYKDYVLALLFIKYISDKYAGVPSAPIIIPEGSSFKDIVALKGKTTIGDDINRKIIAPITEANKLSEMLDFNNSDKIGSGKNMVDNLTKLITIFEDPAFDFVDEEHSENASAGEIFEYFLNSFSKINKNGPEQSITPAEISLLISKLLGIKNITIDTTTIYDPFCGIGSLLFKVARATDKNTTLYGQEINNKSALLAKMNMILHGNITTVIKKGDTLANPAFTEETGLKTFDFVVSDPPRSLSGWSHGIDTLHDTFGRFQSFGVPPPNNGDFAFLLHLVGSLKTTGKGACIISPGVLSRNNKAESNIRANLIRSGYIKGIIELPSNLFHGTAISTCIMLFDKENADSRKGIFMIDASNEFENRGNNNRLRDIDIQKISDTYANQLEIPFYSRMVKTSEILDKKYNLNISRYIDNNQVQQINNLQTEYKNYKDYFIGDISIEINSTPGEFENKNNVLYIPKTGKTLPSSSLENISLKHQHYFQIILRPEIVDSKYLEIFFKSKIGILLLEARKKESNVPSLNKADISELKVFIPDPATQELIIKTSIKLDQLGTEIVRFESQLSLNPDSSKKIQSTLTSALLTLDLLNDEDQALELIRQGESANVEFKQTFSKDVARNIKENEKKIRESSLKNIVAFLNTDGGTLLIGVTDSKEITGIENDNYENDDKYLLNFNNNFREHIGEDKLPLVKWKIIRVSNAKILRVDCAKSNKPVFLYKVDFYVRSNPAATKLEGYDMQEYIEERFKKIVPMPSETSTLEG